MRRAALFLFIGLFLLFMAGCGSQSQVTSPPVSNPVQADASVSLTVTDTPPAGVTVLFFQLSITGAALTSSSGSTVSLLPSTNPIPVNVTQLQTESAFLGSQNVAAGTYDSLGLTFSPNTQLTIFNGSGAAIGSCANNTVCQLTPVPGSLTLSFSTTPFPVTLAANSPLAFKLDIHLDTVIQTNLSVNLAAPNGVTVSQLPPPPSGAPVSPLGNLTGVIQGLLPYSVIPNPDGIQFLLVLQTGDGRSFQIGVNNSTTYNYPSSVCSTNSFACLAPQQIVKVEVSLQTGGTLLASQVTYVQPAGQQVVEGNIIGLSTWGGNTIMDLIIQQQPPPPNSATAIPVGQHAGVNVPSTGVTYAIDSGTFAIPSGLTFTSATSLQVGQTVQVVVVPSSVDIGVSTSANVSGGPAPVGPAILVFTASSITLEPSQITGTVASLPASGSTSFTLATLPVLFVPPSATPGATSVLAPVIITIDTTSATTFTNITGLSGLNLNDGVSVGGWVFSTPSGATKVTVAAQAVVDRGAVPLF